MRILVIAPMAKEKENFSNALKTCKCKHSYKVIEAGIGKVESATTLAIELSDPTSNYDLVANIGYAAGSHIFEQGDISIPVCTRYHDVDVPESLCPHLTKEYDLLGVEGVTCLTGDSFIWKEKAEELVKEYGDWIIFDMECTALAQVCEGANIPLIQVKMISDIPQREDLPSFSEFIQTHNDFRPMLDYLESLSEDFV